jgi:hypothetical protein
MSLGVVIKGPEGIVLAADSRVTLTAGRQGQPPIPINFDNATKLLGFSKPNTHVGVVTYGAAVIGSRTAHSFIPEIEIELQTKKELSIEDFSSELSDFFLKQWKKVVTNDDEIPSMLFIVGGYDKDEAYGKVFLVDIPRNPSPLPQNAGENDFGMTWGGQLQIASRIIHGIDPVLPMILKEELKISDKDLGRVLGKIAETLEFSIPYAVLPLQDCVDLATFMVRTTMDAQNLAIGVRGVGGPIDVAVITRTDGLRFIQRKEITINSSRG